MMFRLDSTRPWLRRKVAAAPDLDARIFWPPTPKCPTRRSTRSSPIQTARSRLDTAPATAAAYS
jgi:hypothetical protein